MTGSGVDAGGLRSEGIGFRYLTNTTSRPRAAVADKLTRLGIPAAAEEVLTPAVVVGDLGEAAGTSPP
jgi:phospholysine phosphohistidine inorganic pyrophosphate phosphatase